MDGIGLGVQGSCLRDPTLNLEQVPLCAAGGQDLSRVLDPKPESRNPEIRKPENPKTRKPENTKPGFLPEILNRSPYQPSTTLFFTLQAKFLTQSTKALTLDPDRYALNTDPCVSYSFSL